MLKKKKSLKSKYNKRTIIELPPHITIVFFAIACVLVGAKIILISNDNSVLGLSDSLKQKELKHKEDISNGIPLFEASHSGKTLPVFRGKPEISGNSIRKPNPSLFPTKKPENGTEKEHIELHNGTSSGKIELDNVANPTRLDTLSEKIKTKFVVQGGKLKVKAERKDGTEVELDSKSSSDVEKRLENDDIRFASGAAGRVIIKSGTSSAEAKFPLSYDPVTNQVLLTTPNGDKAVKIMPEQALKGLLNSNAIKSFNASESGMILEDKNGKPVYVIKGKQSKKIFSFIPVEIENEVEVSAETGDIVSQNLSFGSQLLNLISN